MKEAYWGYWLMVLGIFIIVVLLLVQSFTSTNTQDFYLIKEIAESSMVDAVDYGYYRTFGELKISKEKFYESFIRRFAEEASVATTYKIRFTEIYESPPKVGIKVSSKANYFSIMGDENTFDIVNKVDAIIESNEKEVASNANPRLERTRDYADINYLLSNYSDSATSSNIGPIDCSGIPGSDFAGYSYEFNLADPGCTQYSNSKPIIRTCFVPSDTFLETSVKNYASNDSNHSICIIQPEGTDDSTKCFAYIPSDWVNENGNSNICYAVKGNS